MKRFLKERGGIDQYNGVRIEWIRHHTPELIVTDENGKQSTIDLSVYKYADLHALFRKKFALKSTVESATATTGRALAAAISTRDTPMDAPIGAPSAVPTTSLSNDAHLLQPELIGPQMAETTAERLWNRPPISSPLLSRPPTSGVVVLALLALLAALFMRSRCLGCPLGSPHEARMKEHPAAQPVCHLA